MGIPDPKDILLKNQTECKLLGNVGLIVQVVLGLITFIVAVSSRL